jgi:hypothetical protein
MFTWPCARGSRSCNSKRDALLADVGVRGSATYLAQARGMPQRSMLPQGLDTVRFIRKHRLGADAAGVNFYNLQVFLSKSRTAKRPFRHVLQVKRRKPECPPNKRGNNL